MCAQTVNLCEMVVFPFLIKAQVWDLGGQANLRPSWATYYRATDAVIVVIDSTDRARASIAKVGGVPIAPSAVVNDLSQTEPGPAYIL